MKPFLIVTHTHQNNSNETTIKETKNIIWNYSFGVVELLDVTIVLIPLRPLTQRQRHKDKCNNTQ